VRLQVEIKDFFEFVKAGGVMAGEIENCWKERMRRKVNNHEDHPVVMR